MEMSPTQMLQEMEDQGVLAYVGIGEGVKHDLEEVDALAEVGVKYIFSRVGDEAWGTELHAVAEHALTLGILPGICVNDLLTESLQRYTDHGVRFFLGGDLGSNIEKYCLDHKLLFIPWIYAALDLWRSHERGHPSRCWHIETEDDFETYLYLRQHLGGNWLLLFSWQMSSESVAQRVINAAAAGANVIAPCSYRKTPQESAQSFQLLQETFLQYRRKA